MKRKELLFLVGVALLIAAIFGLPHLLIPYFLGERPYFPLVLDGAPIFTADELTWPAAEAREVMDGRLIPTDPVVWEHKDTPSLTGQIPVIIIGLLGRLFGSIPAAFVFLGIILPPLVFFLLYFFIYLLTADKLASVLASVAVLTLTRLLQFFPPMTPAIAQAFLGYLTNRGVEPAPLEFFRLPNPLLVFPFLLVALIALYWLMEKRSFKAALVGGFFLGLLFYTYFYFWSFVATGATLMLLFSLLKRDGLRAKLLIIFLALGLFVSLFYWFNFFRFLNLPQKEDILWRAGIEFRRWPNLFRSAQFLVFGWLFWLMIKKKNGRFWFLLTLLVAGIICLNIQLLTGVTFQPFHWTLRVLNPLALVMAGFSYFRFLSHKIYYKALTVFLIGLVLAVGFWIQFSFTQKSFAAYTLGREKIDALTWLNKNTPKDSVVGSVSIETNSLIPAYTHNNVFLPNGGATLAPTEEIIRRVYIISSLFGILPEELEKTLAPIEISNQETENCRQDHCLANRKLAILEKNRAFYYFHFGAARWQESLSDWTFVLGLPKEQREAIVGEYQKYYRSENWRPGDLRLDYLFVGPAEKDLSPTPMIKYPFVLPVFQNSLVTIFQIKP